jgi:hypothetical protein
LLQAQGWPEQIQKINHHPAAFFKTCGMMVSLSIKTPLQKGHFLGVTAICTGLVIAKAPYVVVAC